MNERPIRIRLDLTEVNLHPFKYVWVPLVHRDLRTIGDFKISLCQRFNFDKNQVVKLFVQNSLLLDEDTVFLLREDDTVKVVYDQILINQNEENLTSSSNLKKKKRKHSYDQLDSKETKYLRLSKSKEISKSEEDLKLNTIDNNSLLDAYVSEYSLTSLPSISNVSKTKCNEDIGSAESPNPFVSATEMKKQSKKASHKVKPTNDIIFSIDNAEKSNLISKSSQIVVAKKKHRKDIENGFDTSNEVKKIKQSNKKSSDTQGNDVVSKESACKSVIKSDSLKKSMRYEQNKNCKEVNNSFLNESDLPDRSSHQSETLSLNVDYDSIEGKTKNSLIDDQTNPDKKVEIPIANSLEKKKRKRNRTRKSNKKVNLTNSVGSSKEQSSKPNSFQFESISDYDPNIRKHIIFTDNNTNECNVDSAGKHTKMIPLNSYLNQFKSSDEKSCTQISSEKSNLSDFIVMSTPKNCTTGNALNSWNMTSVKKEAEDESTTNFEINSLICSKNEQNKVVDYTNLPSLNKLPEIGTQIAYKLLELSDLYCPEISDYKEGIVTDVNTQTGEMVIELVKEEIKCGRTGKFENLYSDEMPDPVVIKNVKMSWSSLIEPKLVGNM